MSILSSTGSGKELAYFNDLYQRKEQLYYIYSLFPSLSEFSFYSAIFDVYSREEINFMYEYITKFNWCKDEKFVKIVNKVWNLLNWREEQKISSKFMEDFTMDIDPNILDKLEEEFMRFSGVPNTINL